jgi:hypothetical protein
MQPQSPEPARKKSGNGCLIALAVAGGLFIVTVGLIAFSVWRFAGSKEGKAVFGAIGDAARIAAEAQSAPGAAEVRALGCDQAMVIDMERMSQLLERFDASAPKGTFSTMVLCQIGASGHEPPSCDRVAETYHAAAGVQARTFAANVSHGGTQVCSTLYDAQGNKVRDLPSGK